MSALRDAVLVARYGFIRAFRERLLYITLIALALILPLVAGIDLENEATRSKVSADLGLFLIDVSVWLLALASVHALISTDVDRGGLVPILARGVSPFSLLLGRWVALSGFLALNVIFIASCVAALISSGAGDPTALMMRGVLAAILKGLLFLAFLIAVAVTVAPVTTLATGLFAWVIGHGVAIIVHLNLDEAIAASVPVTALLAMIPDLSLFSFSLGRPLDPVTVGLDGVRVGGFVLAFLGLGAWCLGRRLD